MPEHNNPVIKIEAIDERHLLLTIAFGEVTWKHKFRTHSAAKMAAVKRMSVEHQPVLRKQTLRQYATEWQRDYLSRECAEETSRDYEKCLRKLVLPRLGNVSIDRITPSVVDVFTDQLYAEGGCWTVHRGRRTLSAMLGVAESWGYIARNPVTRRR